jgi:hypothetical protein
MSSGSSHNNLCEKVSQTHELIVTSYHEAGHSIFGLLNFMRINSVTIHPTTGSGDTRFFPAYIGLFEYPSLDPILNKSLFCNTIQDSKLIEYWVKTEMCLFYAGTCAERIYFKNISGLDKMPLHLQYGCDKDISEAAALCKLYNLAAPGKKRYVLKQKMLKETSKKLNKYWDDIILISHALVNKKQLLHKDIKSILCKKSKNKLFWKEQFKNIDFILKNLKKLSCKDIKNLLQ